MDRDNLSQAESWHETMTRREILTVKVLTQRKRQQAQSFY